MKKLIVLFLLIPSVCYGAIVLNGDADYLEGTALTGLPNTIGTISFYFIPTTVADVSEGLVELGDGTSGNRVVVYFAAGVGGNLDLFITDGTGKNVWVENDIESVFTAGIRYHVLFTFNTVTDEFKGYIDGSEWTPDTTDTIGNPTGIDQINIGSFFGGTNVRDMTITDVAVWDVVLSQSEITALAESKVKRLSLQIQPNNLQAYYPLDDLPTGSNIDGVEFLDLSGNDNHVTGTDADSDSVAEEDFGLTYQ